MLEIDILRNFSKKIWVSWGVLFKGLGVQKDSQTKTMSTYDRGIHVVPSQN